MDPAIEAENLKDTQSGKIDAPSALPPGILPVLEVSTAHLPEWERDNIHAASPRVVDHEYGWIVWVSDPDCDFMHEWSPFPNLLAIVRKANEHDCMLICLDSDGHEHDDLPTFETSENTP